MTFSRTQVASHLCRFCCPTSSFQPLFFPELPNSGTQSEFLYSYPLTICPPPLKAGSSNWTLREYCSHFPSQQIFWPWDLPFTLYFTLCEKRYNLDLTIGILVLKAVLEQTLSWSQKLSMECQTGSKLNFAMWMCGIWLDGSTSCNDNQPKRRYMFGTS